MKVREFQIGFADLVIDFRSEFPLPVPMELEPFLYEGGCPTDSYELQILRGPLNPRGEQLLRTRGISAYREEEGTLTIHGDESVDSIVFA